MKIWKTIIQQRKEVLIVSDDMTADMEANEKLSPIVTELFLREIKLNLFLYHNILYHNLTSKTKMTNRKYNTIQRNKPIRSRYYHQEILVSMDF